MERNVVKGRAWALRLPILLFVLTAAAPLLADAVSSPGCPLDFRAFYCGGQAVAVSRDPYRTEPLWDCELAALAVNGVPPTARHVLPAPLPPYALALFVLFAHLPFPIASLMWAAAGILAIAATAVLLARSMGFPLILTIAALIPSEVCLSLFLGQIVPLVVFALCAASSAILERNYKVTAAAIACAIIEPHVALPALLALACFTPSMRRPLAVACVLLGTVSLIAVGPATCAEYIARVLPLHARSEIVNYRFQYSLTSLLWIGGVGKEDAVALGEASYLLMGFIGVAMAHRLSRRFNDERFLVLIPPAISLIGGPFLHSAQMTVALPAALLLAQYVSRHELRRLVVAVVFVCLAIPWETVSTLPEVAARLPADPPATATSPSPPQPKPEELAELPWTRQMEAFTVRHPPNVLVKTVFKLPTWFGLIVMLGIGLRMASRMTAQPRLATYGVFGVPSGP